MDLAGFLAARLGEKEAWARKLIADWEPPAIWHSLGQQMLREAAAGRAILALHRRRSTEFIDADGDDRTSYDCPECRNHGLPDSWPCKTLRIGAAVHSDHPGYQQEWKP